MTIVASVPAAFSLDILDLTTLTTVATDFFAVPSSIKDGEVYSASLDANDVRKQLNATLKYTTTKTGEKKFFVRFDHTGCNYAISATFTVPVLSADPSVIPPSESDIQQTISSLIAFLTKYLDSIALHREIPGNVASE